MNKSVSAQSEDRIEALTELMGDDDRIEWIGSLDGLAIMSARNIGNIL